LIVAWWKCRAGQLSRLSRHHTFGVWPLPMSGHVIIHSHARYTTQTNSPPRATARPHGSFPATCRFCRLHLVLGPCGAPGVLKSYTHLQFNSSSTANSPSTSIAPPRRSLNRDLCHLAVRSLPPHIFTRSPFRRIQHQFLASFSLALRVLFPCIRKAAVVKISTMSSFGGDESFERPCTTTLSVAHSSFSNTGPASTARNTRNSRKARVEDDLTGAGNPMRTPLLHLRGPQQPPTATPSRRRRRQPSFSIFLDVEAANAVNADAENAENRVPKRAKTKARSPLSDRTDFGNVTPAPSPRLPMSSFLMTPRRSLRREATAPTDENNQPIAPMTPPGTPVTGDFLPRLRAPSLTAPRPAPVLGPTPNAGPPPPFVRTVRFPRFARARADTYNPLPAPVNMTLYDLLELANWNASIGEIMAAYRDVAMRAHPDRAAEDERDAATLKMQLINGAKEVLSDHHLRRQYHVDGVLPWAA
jgi:hypothetical protein